MLEFKLPDLGEGIHEGEILKWHVQPGQSIEEDGSLVDIETDKTAVTIPSPRAGQVVKTVGKPGDIILEVDQEPVKDLDQFNRKVQGYKLGDTVLFLIKRQGATLFLTLKAGK